MAVWMRRISGTPYFRKYDSDGNYEWQFNTFLYTGSNTGFDVDDSGNMYYASSNASTTTRIRRLSSSGSLDWTQTFGTAAGSVCVRYADGFVYAMIVFSGDSFATFYKLDASDGSISRTTTMGTTNHFGPGSMFVFADGSGYCCASSGSQYVRKFDADGAEEWVKDLTASGSAYTTSVCADSTQLYITYRNGFSTAQKAVSAWDLEGTGQVWSYGSSSYQFHGGTEVCQGQDGTLYVSCLGTPNESVIALTTAGALVWANSDTTGGTGVSIDDDGHIVRGSGSGNQGDDNTVRKFNSSSGSSEWSFVLDNHGVRAGYGVLNNSPAGLPTAKPYIWHAPKRNPQGRQLP